MSAAAHDALIHEPIPPGQGMNPDRLIGATVKRLRTKAGMTQAELASQMVLYGCRMQQQTVLKIERSIRRLRFTEALAIARILGVGIEDLVTEETWNAIRLPKPVEPTTFGTIAVDQNGDAWSCAHAGRWKSVTGSREARWVDLDITEVIWVPRHGGDA